MEDAKHNKAFDELLRSKYQDEKVQPSAHLWKNIQSMLPAAPKPVKPWYLSKAMFIGGSIVTVLGVATVLLFFIYLKPLRLSSHLISGSKPVTSVSPFTKLKSNETSPKTALQVSNSTVHTSLVAKTKEKTVPAKEKLMTATKALSLVTNKKMVSGKISKSSFLEKDQNAVRNVFLITPMKKISFAFPPVVASVAARPPAFTNMETGYVVLSGAKKKQKKSILHPWSVEVFIMPEFSSRFIAPNPDYTQGLYTSSYFNSREHHTFNYSYGFLVDYRFLHSLSVETGLSYYAYAIDFSTQSSYFEKTGEHSGVVFTSSGQVGLNINQVDSLDNKAMLNSFSRFRYLSVPFILKYYPFKGLFIDAGPTIDYFFKQSNNWEKQDQEGDFILESGDVEGVNRLNFSFIFGVGYEQIIWKSFGFSINPTIRVHLRKLNPYSTVKTYPFNVGLRVSLRYGL